MAVQRIASGVWTVRPLVPWRYGDDVVLYPQVTVRATRFRVRGTVVSLVVAGPDGEVVKIGSRRAWRAFLHSVAVGRDLRGQ